MFEYLRRRGVTRPTRARSVRPRLEGLEDRLLLYSTSGGSQSYLDIQAFSSEVRLHQFGDRSSWTTATLRGDYSSDRMADIAVFRPSGGTWYIQDGDGKADIAVSSDFDGAGDSLGQKPSEKADDSVGQGPSENRGQTHKGVAASEGGVEPAPRLTPEQQESVLQKIGSVNGFTKRYISNTRMRIDIEDIRQTAICSITERTAFGRQSRSDLAVLEAVDQVSRERRRSGGANVENLDLVPDGRPASVDPLEELERMAEGLRESEVRARSFHNLKLDIQVDIIISVSIKNGQDPKILINYFKYDENMISFFNNRIKELESGLRTIEAVKRRASRGILRLKATHGRRTAVRPRVGKPAGKRDRREEEEGC